MYFLSKVVTADKDPSKVKVKEVMSTRLITIKPSDTIKEAAQTMIGQKGRLVALKEGKVVGIVTASDLIKTLPKIPETLLKVHDIMTKKVVVVRKETDEMVRQLGMKDLRCNCVW